MLQALNLDGDAKADLVPTKPSTAIVSSIIGTSPRKTTGILGSRANPNADSASEPKPHFVAAVILPYVAFVSLLRRFQRQEAPPRVGEALKFSAHFRQAQHESR